MFFSDEKKNIKKISQLDFFAAYKDCKTKCVESSKNGQNNIFKGITLTTYKKVPHLELFFHSELTTWLSFKLDTKNANVSWSKT